MSQNAMPRTHHDIFKDALEVIEDSQPVSYDDHLGVYQCEFCKYRNDEHESDCKWVRSIAELKAIVSVEETEWKMFFESQKQAPYINTSGLTTVPFPDEVADSAGIAWSKFTPTAEIPEDLNLFAYKALVFGDFFGSWDLLHGGNVNRYFDVDMASRFAGEGAWWQRRVVLIRHADGVWAKGYNPTGPCQPGCGTRYPRESISYCGDFVTTPDHCYCVTDGDQDIACCTSYCMARARAALPKKEPG